MRSSVLLVVTVLALPALAGCLGGTGSDLGGKRSDVQPTSNTSRPDSPAPDERSHVHNRWNGQEVKTVFDNVVTTGPTWQVDPRDSLLDSAVCAASCASRVQFAPPEGKIVPPGTERVTFTPAWNASAPPGTQLFVWAEYMAANMTSVEKGDIGRVRSGKTYTINTTVAMADGGHATQSLWRFQLTVSYCAGATVGRRECAWRQGDSFDAHVTVKAHRTDGRLPRAPPHPDWWADGPRRPVLQGGGNATSVGVLPWLYASRRCAGCDSYGLWQGDDHAPIPPGTRQLVVTVNWTNTATTPEKAGVRPWLAYHTGHQTLMKRAPDGERNGTSWRLVMPIRGNQTDGMYARNRSRWTFEFGFQGRWETGMQEPVTGSPITNPYVFDGTWSIDITAVNPSS